jgi:hypothetical protein
VNWTAPKPESGFDGWTTTTQEEISYRTCYPPVAALTAPPYKKRKRTISTPSGVRITTTYWYPPAPVGPSAGYTVPLAGWESTEIRGLTTQVIRLKSDWSQAFRPQHHNFGEDFVFQPGVEPGLRQSLLNQLRQKDIAYIWTDGESVKLVNAAGVARDP